MSPFFFRRVRKRFHRIPRGIPRDLSPYLMRDIGLEPWPERPHMIFHPLW